MTRVLHLIKGLGPGGAEQLLVNQARSAPGRELDATVGYLVSWKNHVVPRIEAAGWGTVCFASDRSWDLRWTLRLRRFLRSESIEVVHGHSPLVSSMARLVVQTLPKSQRPRMVYTEHNEWPRHRRGTRRLNQATMRFEDHVLAVSDAVAASMPADREVEVLVHGIDVDAVAAERANRDAVRAELGIGDDEIVIGTVANFRREKAYDVMLEAARAVCDADPRVRFVAVGQGPLEDEIRSLHRDLGLGDRFLLLGYRDDATRVMSAFDIFTLSSNHEGLPVSLMDAMALDLAVVATAVGGIPQASVGTDAAIVAPGDAAALAAGYRSMIEALPTRTPDTQRRFDIAAAAARLLDIYRTR